MANAKKRLTQTAKPIVLFFTHLILAAEFLYGRAGGGGGSGGGGGGGGYRHSSGSSGGDGTFELVLIIAMVIFGILCAIMAIYRQIRKVAKINSINKLLKTISLKELGWNPLKIEKYVRKNFLDIQRAWGDNDLVRLNETIHPDLYPSWSDQINEFKSNGQRNAMDKIRVRGIKFIDIKNFKDDEKDEFTVEIKAHARDRTIDSSGKTIKSITSNFSEFWTFEREGEEWLLREVHQRSSMKEFLKPAINEGA